MEDQQRQSVGAVVRTLREAAGLSRQDLVDRTADRPEDRVGLEMLAKVEQGRKAPSARTLAKLAHALDLEPTDLSSRAAQWEAGLQAGMAAGALRASVFAPWSAVRAATGASAASGAMLGAVAGMMTPFPIAVGAIGGAMYGRERARQRELTAALEHRLKDLLATASEDQLERLAAALDRLGDDGDGVVAVKPEPGSP